MNNFILVFTGSIVSLVLVSSENLPERSFIITPLEQLLYLTTMGHHPNKRSYTHSTEENRSILEKKCEVNVEHEVRKFAECIEILVDYTQLKAEIEQAKPFGDLDIVFRKYCRQSPFFKECISDFTAALEPCLEQPEEESRKIVHNITDSLLNFICFKEGDRIALFIAEGGPECFEEKKILMMDCLNKTYFKYLPAEAPSTNRIPSIVLEEEQCKDIKVAQSCVVRVLEQCSDPTPANIVDSLFNYVWKSIPCSQMSFEHDTIPPHIFNSSVMLFIHFLTIFFALIAKCF